MGERSGAGAECGAAGAPISEERGAAGAPPAERSEAGPGLGLYQQEFAVRFAYPVYFTRDALTPGNPALLQALQRGSRERARLYAVLDAGLAAARPATARELRAYCAAHAGALELIDEPLEVVGGEAAKQAAQVESLLARFQALHLDRHSHVLVIGGGAVQDMAGYAAAIAHRGLRLVRMPSTVLAQSDGGVGVKNGINAFDTKNFLGCFAPPAAVVDDFALLDTLPAREARAGMAESVKVALIRDAEFFGWLCANAGALARCEPAPLAHLVQRGAELHLRHIAGGGDPFEYGSARPLDYGHWSAHKLESLSGYRLRHGEAVAIGMALDARYACEAGWLPEPALEQICGLLESLGLRLWDEALELLGPSGQPRVLEGLAEFREHLGGRLTITLLAGVGKGFEVHEMDTPRVARALQWLRRRAHS